MESYLPLLRKLTEKLPIANGGRRNHISASAALPVYVEDKRVASLKLDAVAASVVRLQPSASTKWMIMYEGKLISDMYGEELGLQDNTELSVIGMLFPVT